MWNSGSTASITLSGSPLIQCQLATALCMIEPWWWTQPLGAPVVPLVYGSRQGVSGSPISTGGGSVVASASNQGVTGVRPSTGRSQVLSQPCHSSGTGRSWLALGSKASA